MTDQPNLPEKPDEEKQQSKDLLGDVRQALIQAEEEEEKQPKKKNIITKLFKKKGKKSDEAASEDEDSDDHSEVDDLSSRLSSQALTKQEEELDTDVVIDKLYEDLTEETETEDVDVEEVDNEEEIETDSDEESEPEPEEKEEEEEEKPSAPKPQLAPTSEKGKKIDNIRDVALEDYTEEPAVEIDEQKEAWLSFLRTPFVKMKLIERFIIVFLILSSASLLAWVGIQSSGILEPPPAKPTFTPDPSVPVPINVELPGGWSFNLRKGHLNAEGSWDPFGAEWLEGTEICRWVTLPWSEQLEAVIRTLNADDEIRVTMSNLDVITYSVQSRLKIDSTQTTELNLDTPSLLIILQERDSSERWVITSILQPEEQDK